MSNSTTSATLQLLQAIDNSARLQGHHSMPICEIKQKSASAAQNAARWDGDTTLKFVRLYRSHECLWNWKCINYNNKIAREDAYLDIQKKMNIRGFGISEIRNKIRILRSTYSQELKKIKLSKMHGSTGLYTPNVKWFNEMNEFLKLNKAKGEVELPKVLIMPNFLSHDEPPVISLDDIKSEPETQDDSSLEACDDTFTEEGMINEETETCPNDYILSSDVDNEVVLIPKPKRAKLEDDLRVQENGNSSHRPELEQLPESEQLDEFDIFGRHVAAQLKLLTTLNAIRATEKIQTVLSAYRMQELKQK